MCQKIFLKKKKQKNNLPSIFYFYFSSFLDRIFNYYIVCIISALVCTLLLLISSLPAFAHLSGESPNATSSLAHPRARLVSGADLDDSEDLHGI